MSAMVVLWLGACSGHGASSSQPASTPAPTVTATPAQPGAASAASTPAPLPALQVLARVDQRAASFVVQNHDSSVVQLARAVAIERAQGDGFAPFEQSGLALRGSCTDSATGCVALASGGELRPPAWDTHKAAVVCDTSAGPTAAIGPHAVPAGRYRFVLRTCDGGRAVPSEPFELR